MTDTKTPSPSDAELIAFATAEQFILFCDADEFIDIARAVLAKWGQPLAVAGGEPLRAAAIELRDAPDLRAMQRATAKLYAAIDTAPPPQAVREPTPIRLAALELYTPPFRHEYGYIRDANNQMVADDAGSEASGLIASRIRGWGRIQYLDKPEQRAAALQDEVAEVVAEALNAYWAAHGITKGGQHGAE